MGKTEIIIFIILTNAVLFILLAGIFMFVFKYRKRKLLHEKQIETVAEQHKIDLMNTQLNVQHQTMQYIGQEIHDSVAQKLTLASIYAGQIGFKNTVPDIAPQLSGISKLINDSLAELRQLSRNLTDTKLQNADLKELILLECKSLEATGFCKTTLDTGDIPSMDIAAKSSLLRIIQEFIQNSLKHSNCKNINISMSSSNNELIMYLNDDGKGFDMNEQKHKGIGLDNIRRRVLALNGDLNIKSSTGSGTQFRIIIPVNDLKKNV